MRLAIFGDYQLPLPPVCGGSVPNLVSVIIDQNEKVGKYNIDCYSCFDMSALEESKKYKYTKFVYSRDARFIRFLTNLAFKTKIPFVNIGDIPLPPTAKAYFRKQKYDAVYVAGYIRGLLDISRNTTAPIIYHHHVVTDIIHEKTINGLEIVDICSKLCFVSDFATGKAQTGSSEQNAKMCTFPNVVPGERNYLERKEENRLEIRTKYHIKADEKVVLFVGRMTPDKGCLELIKAFKNAEISNTKLLVLGGATYSSKKRTHYIDLCFEAAQSCPSIIFCGYVDYREIYKYYQASDISTLLSKCDEACGLVGLESIAAGLPLITTDRGGIKEYIPLDCKITVSDGEKMIQDIESALKKLCINEDLLKKMSNCTVYSKRLTDNSGYFDNFVSLIDECVR